MIFSRKKKSSDNQSLTIRFNRVKMKYMAYDSNGMVIDENNLTLMEKKHLASLNKELESKPDLRRRGMIQSINADRAEELRKMGFPCKSFEVLYSNRDVKRMSPEIKEYLTKLVQEEDVLIGVHRTGEADLDDIVNILKCGLIVNSLNGGNTATPIHLMNTVSYYPNNETILKEVINADVYKDSLGVILVKIPDNALSGNIFMIDSENGNFYLDPMYIIGFIPVGPNGVVSEIISYHHSDKESPFKPITSIYDDREYAANVQDGQKANT